MATLFGCPEVTKRMFPQLQPPVNWFIMLFQNPIISEILANPSTRQLKSFSSSKNRANQFLFWRSLRSVVRTLPPFASAASARAAFPCERSTDFPRCSNFHQSCHWIV